MPVRAFVIALALALPGVALGRTVDLSRGQTSVALDLETLEAVGLTLVGVSPEVIAPGALAESVAFPVTRRDAEPPLLATDFSYDASDFLGTFSGSIEHAGTLDLDFDETPLTIGNFTIAFDEMRSNQEASGFFVASTTGLAAPLFDIAITGVDATATGLQVMGDLLVSPELAATLGDEGLTGADVGDAQVDAGADVAIAGGRTSVLLDTEALSGAGLDLSSVSEDVIVPGTLEGSVAFAINPIDALAPALPTTFTFEPDAFLTTFAGTIEHAGEVRFNEDATVVGDFTIGFDAARIGEATTGFFVASTTGVAAPIFDVASDGLGVTPRETGLEISGDLLVSPELAGVLGNAGLTGADVGDFLVEGLAATKVEVGGGQTNVVLDLDALSGAGLDLSSLSDEVIVPGTLDESVAFGVNGRDAAVPALATTFAYDPTDFLSTFEGTIEHTGTIGFNEDALFVGDFSIAFDESRIDNERSGFFVSSTTGLAAALFDVATDDLEVDAKDTTLEIEGDLLVSPELAETLGNAGLAGADVGDFRVEATVPEPTAFIAGFAVAAALLALRRRRRF